MLNLTKNLELFLKTALHNGKKVYLYGGLTPGKYEELPSQPLEVKVRSADEGAVRSVFIKDIDQQNGGKSLDETTIQEVIGYTLEDSDLNVFMLNYKNMDENGNEIPVDSSIMLREIVEHEQRINEPSSAAVIVKSNSGDIRTVGGLYGQKSAEMITQWMLYKENSESDPDYDYFALQDIIRINKISGSTDAKKLKVTHDLIYSKDDLYAAAPGNSSSGPYTVTFGYPWTLTWSFTYDGNPSISLSEDWSNDKATWEITPSWLKSLQSSDRFQLGSSWKAKVNNKNTGVKVSHLTEWHSLVQHMFDLDNSFSITYSW